MSTSERPKGMSDSGPNFRRMDTNVTFRRLDTVANMRTDSGPKFSRNDSGPNFRRLDSKANFYRTKKEKTDSSNDGVSASETGYHRSYTLTNKVENTFRLNPDLPFSSHDVEVIAETVLTEQLKDVNYDPAKCKMLSQELAADIMEKVKVLNYKRYKLVAVVSIGSIKERPGLQFGSRCLWNQKTDNFASVKYTNGSLFAVAMIYGLYFD